MKTPLALAALTLSASIALAGYDTPQQTVAAIGAAFAAQKAPSLAEFLPVSYQKDLSGVAQLFGQKMDPDLWKGVTDFVSAAAKTASAKADLILPETIEGADRAATVKSFANGLSAVSTYFASDAAKLDSIKAGYAIPALDALVSAVLPAVIADESPEDIAKAFTVLKSQTLDNGDVSLTFANDEFSETVVGAAGDDATSDTVTFRKVEGCWLPVDIVDGWKESVSGIRDSIGKLDFTSIQGQQTKAQMLMLLPSLKMGLANIEKAGTRDELEQSASMMLLPLMMMGGNLNLPGLQ
jgi:hypothetical protein